MTKISQMLRSGASLDPEELQVKMGDLVGFLDRYRGALRSFGGSMLIREVNGLLRALYGTMAVVDQLTSAEEVPTHVVEEEKLEPMSLEKRKSKGEKK